MRKLTFALAVGMLLGVSGFATTPAVAVTTRSVKVVIVVGQTQSATAGYISQANSAADRFRSLSTSGRPVSVTTVFSPHATWSAVNAAAKGANILIYMGHGNGYPNPYVSWLQPFSDNGMGLDGSTKNKTYYYGEALMAQLELSPNAIVILNHLCYASGNSEAGRARADGLNEAIAKTRVEGYASGFLRGGAGAVIAEGWNDISYYADALLGPTMSLQTMWAGAPYAHGHVKSWTNSRNPAALAQIDPDYENPKSDGDVYYRSMVAKDGLTTADVIGGTAATFTPQSGSYYPIAPTRVIDTRGYGIGPNGRLASGGAVNYQVAGLGGVPSNAIGITANLTVTSQQYMGYLYVAPIITNGPTSSTINVLVKDNRANGITVGLSSLGTIAVWYGAPSSKLTNFILDVTGYFLPGTAGAGYVPFGPKRVLDTRDGLGLSGPFVSKHHRTFQVAGVAGLPSTGIVAVAGNITVVHPTGQGYVTLGPTATDSPASSTINFPAGDIRANNVIVPVDSNGGLSAVYMAADNATVDIVLDISGYFTATGGMLYHPIAPVRMMDTRTSTPSGFSKFTAPAKQTLTITGGSVPAGAAAISGNLTVTGQEYLGFAAIGPTIDASTNFSNLNFPTGDNRANGVTVPLSPSGTLDVVYVAPSGRRAHLILDVTGYYMGAA